ncbi:hypothetical protein CKO42_02980 [Lamprobacter modestohalophilus]|uniref:Uncharacterized protein n=1 Tax=Lamprobacter modestohalophilus TaxID=1064514 RepID=A0A9X0W5Y7_9GAMM|nr:hypothetical protein [Lamprobacter modestohalophilus]MBK1617436.1 hypothetical protein [Lamprobacter modestohalophilus]
MIRISTAVLIAAVSLSAVVLLFRDPITVKEINDITDTSAAGVESLLAKVDATRTLSFSSTERNSAMIPMTDNRLPIRSGSSPAQSIGQQPPGFVVLDASAPSERIDIGELRDLEGIAIEDSASEPIEIGEPLDADPLADSLRQTAQRSGVEVQDIGPPLPVLDETIDPWILIPARTGD